MSSRSSGLILLAAIATLAAACPSVTDWSVDLPTPVPSTPPPSPTPPFDVGDGADGPLSLNGGTVSPTTCEALLLGTGSNLTFATTTDFDSGDRLLVHRAQDAFPYVEGDGAAIADVGAAGIWEIRTVAEAAGTAVTLTTALTAGYHSSSAGTAQACRMPRFTDVTVGAGTIAAAPWTGAAGGVIAFYVSGTLTIGSSGAISASGAGFRGGGIGASSGACGTADLSSSSAGEKGEGVVPGTFGFSGRGNIATAGGGGNPLHAGGGGGANGGEGGLGGVESFNCTSSPVPAGLGGARVALPADSRALFGGGGGGGDTNGTVTDSAGGRGGGLVMVFVNRLAGAGRIEAAGFDGGDSATDGGGGGGAGGTLILRVIDNAFTGALDLSGGDGGDALSAGTGRGPGGGGGGGRLVADLPIAILVNLTGGDPGLSSNTGTARGSLAGGAGTLQPF